MNVKNPWVFASKLKALNKKLSSLVVSFVGQKYTDTLRSKILSVINGFVNKESLPDHTSFQIFIDKSNPDNIIFSGVKII